MSTLKELKELLALCPVEELHMRLEDLKPYHRIRVEQIIKSFCEKNGGPYVDLIMLNNYMDLGEPIFSGIISKSDFFSRDEKKIVNNHPGLGFYIAEAMVESGFLAENIPTAILYHHESWNGSGLFRLRGNAIPFIVRIISPINFYVALTSDRPWRQALSKQRAVEELLAQSGKIFDPRLIEAVIEAINASPPTCLRSRNFEY